MTKIYVVKSGNINEDKFIIDEVFTNKKKAIAYRDWLMKQEWFNKENIAWIREYVICNIDHSMHDELPY